MFMGASKEVSAADERYDSPGKLAVKRFFRRKSALISVIVLAAMFLFVIIGPIVAPVDLTETGSEMLHANVSPTMNMMKLPSAMKDGTVDISSRGTFTVGLDTDGNVYTWGYYFNHAKDDAQRDVLTVPEEVKNANIIHVAAGSDHVVAIGDDGHVYAWGEYDNGQYGDKGSMIAMCRKMTDELPSDGKVDPTKVKQLLCGQQVTAILMEDGKIYAWGNDGLSATNLSSVIKAGKENGKLVKIAFTNDGIYGIDENGKTINPISAMEEYGKWYNREASSKRGAIILQNDDKIPGLNFFLQSQNKVMRTQMSTLLKSGGKELGEPKGVYEINTGFTIPYGSGDIKSVGLRDKCYAQIGLSSEDGKTADILKIDYNNGKNRIKFFDSEKTADLSENREYNVKIRIYPQNGAYTADVYIGDEEKLLNREPIQLGQLAKMNRLTVDVNGYDSPSTVRMFILNGIDFKCSLTPKLVSCSAAFKKIALKDNVITAEFDTAAPEEAAAYSVDNGAVIESAERVGECGVRLTVGGLKNGESYTLAFDGVKNSDGYGCLDTAVFEVEKKIEVSGVSLDGGKLKNGDNKVTAQLANTTGEQLGASLVILVCRETNGEYRIENAVIENKENIGRNDSITASFSTDGTQFVKAFLLDSADGMKLLYDEMIYR